MNLKINNGFFQYPDLPQPVKNIAIDMKVENPDGITDHTVLDISKGHIEFGNDPFDFSIQFKNPVTVQYLDATLKGKLNLAEITRFVKLKAGTLLSGILDANASAKGNLSTITKHQAGPFTANGFINITGLNYSSPDFPQPIRNSNIQIAFQPRALSGCQDDGICSMASCPAQLFTCQNELAECRAQSGGQRFPASVREKLPGGWQ